MISNPFGLISFKVHQFPRKNANCTKKMTPAAKVDVAFPFYLLLFLTFLWLLTSIMPYILFVQFATEYGLTSN